MAPSEKDKIWCQGSFQITGKCNFPHAQPFVHWQQDAASGTLTPVPLAAWGTAYNQFPAAERELVFFTIGRTTIVNTGRGTSLV